MIKTPFFWTVIFLLTTLIEWTGLKILMDSNSSARIPKYKYYQLFILMISIEILLNEIKLLPPLKVFLIVFMTWNFYRMSYKVSRMKNITVIAVFWMISLGSEGVMMGLITRIYDLGNHMKLLEFSYIRLLFVILTKGLLISVILVYRRLKISIDNDQHGMIHILLPLATNSLVLLFIFGYEPLININTQKYYLMVLGITVLIVLANMSLIVIIRKMTKDYEIKLAYKSYEDKREAEYNYYTQLEKEQEKIRQIYHDMNNHIECIKGLAQNQQQLSKYIQELEDEMPTIKQTFHTGSKVVDTLLRQKSILCDKEYIDLRTSLNLTSCSFITAKDLCSIFANALDNAIEACQNIKDEKRIRYIHIESCQVKQFLVIKIKNSKEHAIKFRGDQIITHKKEKILHGLGLKNIKKCLEKYQAELVLQYTENEFYLKIVVPLNLVDDILNNKNDMLNNNCRIV